MESRFMVTWAGIPKFSLLLGQQWLLALCRKTCLRKYTQKSRVVLCTQALSFPQSKTPNRPLTCALLLLHVLTQNPHYSTLLHFLSYLLKMTPKYDAKFNPAPGSWIPDVDSGSSCIPQPKWWAGQGKSWELTALRHHLVSVVLVLPSPIGNTFPFTELIWINECPDGDAHPSPLLWGAHGAPMQTHSSLQRGASTAQGPQLWGALLSRPPFHLCPARAHPHMRTFYIHSSRNWLIPWQFPKAQCFSISSSNFFGFFGKQRQRSTSHDL